MTRKRSNYLFTLSDYQVEAFLDLALRLDQPFERLLHQALDAYIERESQNCEKPKH